jgi:hypothetical protein
MRTQRTRVRLDTPGMYRVRIQGGLDESWSDQLGGMMMSTTQGAGEAPVTTLTGTLVDQAALGGVLSAIYELGFPLLSVERLEGD